MSLIPVCNSDCSIRSPLLLPFTKSVLILLYGVLKMFRNILFIILVTMELNTFGYNLGCPDLCACIENSTVVDCEGENLLKIPSLGSLPKQSAVLNLAGSNISTMLPQGNITRYKLLRLKSLILQRNNITQFNTRHIALYFPNLKELVLWRNSIKQLKRKNLGKLKHLELLDISNNKIRTIENGIFKYMKLLVKLYLNGNQISSVSSQLLDGLDNLDLSHNHLTLLDIDAFSKTPLLFSLKVTNNILRNWIPENASWPKYVYKLDLSGNKLVHMPPIPAVILRSKGDSYLNLKQNPLFCGCKNLDVNSSLNVDIACRLLITCTGNSNDKSLTDFSRLNENVLSCNKVAASVFTSTMLQRPICVRPKVKTSVRVQFFSLVLHCKAEGFPVPEMSIYYKNETLVSGNVANLQFKLAVGDLQQYICENVTIKCYAESPIGKSESLFELKHTVLEITDSICRAEQNEFDHSFLTTASYNEVVVWEESHILIMIFAILIGITTLSLSVLLM